MKVFSWQGIIGRAQYAISGLVLFAIKYGIDCIVAHFFGRTWLPWNYFIPASGGSIAHIRPEDIPFYFTLLVIALPFIYIGTMLTLRRLRAIHAGQWLTLLFFIPVINLIFFLLLCILPTTAEVPPPIRLTKAAKSPLLDRLIPESAAASAILAVLFNAVSAVLLTRLSADALKNYGWGLFVGLPFCLGFSSVLIFSYHHHRSLKSCFGVAAGAVAFAGFALLAFAVEGVICILMAAPLALLLSLLGAWLGYLLQIRPRNGWQNMHAFFLLMIFLPGYMTGEHLTSQPPTLFAVRTSVDIAANPERIWKYVVAFAELPPPTEWIFKKGIAYPVKAEIQGKGVAAIRRCVFSTGAFVEPIRVWDEPRLLAFDVTSYPQPMHEWSFRNSVRPPHLENFLVSQKGQFELIALPNGHTKLIGTTWYYHHMWPESYWRLWGDYIIHRIHLRVLQHIKERAENIYRRG